MNAYLKSAVQNLDCHIAQVTAIRDQLASGMEVPGAGGQGSGTARAVQASEPEEPKRKAKSGKAKTGKRIGGGRRVKVEGRMQKAETGAAGTAALPGDGAFQPSTLAGAMKFEISRLKAFTLEALQTLVNEKYGGEEFYTKAASNSFYGNLAYWAKTGRLEKSGDGAQASFKVLDAAFFSQVEFQS